ncbi:AAA family ATPase [Endozoicomonas sp. 8E]|uniref:AAA family ATPase n=1 Tax=Endozoicomonas sp. 8E TaxID=3035692 RepID=UPI0029390342|nr:AAA family ATPase [Endozoicomonas sp. 8E]WOG30123.1 AAA family ATPase [Endozoicomonas sp. 8E]
MQNKFVFTGGPCGGKTTTLEELKRVGYCFVSETAREIIQERLSKGLSPRPKLEEFANECLKLDIQKYDKYAKSSTTLFFDRSILDSLYMLNNEAKINASELKSHIEQYEYNPIVFVFSPWQEIYVTDSERDQTFEESQKVSSDLIKWYSTHGYKTIEVPKTSVKNRVEFILKTIKNAV